MRWVLKDRGGAGDPPGPEDIPCLIRRIFHSRGLDEGTEIRRFLEPSLDDLHDPRLLPDLDVAVDRLDHALTQGERIYIFGDYDVDGITSAVLLCRYLAQLGGHVHVRIPGRLTEGYGLSTSIVDEAHTWGTQLLIAVDCGTTARREIEYARALGIDVIVADHHVPDAALPCATAVVNPWLPGSAYPFSDLAAVGVVTKILQGLWQRRCSLGRDAPSPFALLDLTALGTVADGVALLGENRLLVLHGLRLLRSSPRAALQALVESACLDAGEVSATDLAFQVVPRLNAAGRLGDGTTALDLLLSEDPERCRFLASVLDRHNMQRRKLLDELVQEAIAQAHADGAPGRGEPLVLASSRWHPGVLGIAAARLADRFGVPTILLSSEGTMSRGSGRSAGGWDLLELVRGCAHRLCTFGGHRAAIGLTLETSSLPGFRAELLEAARALSAPTGPVERVLAIDARASLAEVDFPLLEWLKRLQPFGAGNPDPLFALQGRLVGGPRVLKQRHLRFEIADAGVCRECIGFEMADRAEDLHGIGADIHVAVTAAKNSYRGQERVQLQVRDIAIGDPFGIA